MIFSEFLLEGRQLFPEKMIVCCLGTSNILKTPRFSVEAYGLWISSPPRGAPRVALNELCELHGDCRYLPTHVGRQVPHGICISYLVHRFNTVRTQLVHRIAIIRAGRPHGVCQVPNNPVIWVNGKVRVEIECTQERDKADFLWLKCLGDQSCLTN